MILAELREHLKLFAQSGDEGLIFVGKIADTLSAMTKAQLKKPTKKPTKTTGQKAKKPAAKDRSGTQRARKRT